jgi:hypothetical protein
MPKDLHHAEECTPFTPPLPPLTSMDPDPSEIAALPLSQPTEIPIAAWERDRVCRLTCPDAWRHATRSGEAGNPSAATRCKKGFRVRREPHRGETQATKNTRDP